MENNTNLKRVSALLIAATIIALIVHLVGLDIFNKREIVVHGNDSSSASYMEIDARKDSTSTWVKRDYNLFGETVNITGATIVGELHNMSDDTINNWTLTINITGDCLINQAWNGEVEIHQFVGTTDEVVQRLNLQNYKLDDVELAHLYDGDLLIPLKKGDYVIYFPNEQFKEMPLAGKDSTKIGVIFYYRDTLDLSDYDLEFQYHRTFTQGPTFLVFALFAALCFIFVLMAAVSNITYKRAQTEMEHMKSGIMSLSDMYAAIYLIDLTTGDMAPISVDKESERLHPWSDGAKAFLDKFTADAEDAYKDVMREFTDVNTLAGRLKDRDSIVCEYVSKKYGWSSVRFFAMDRIEGQPIEKVVFTAQDVNEEKSELDRIEERVTQAESETEAKSLFLANVSRELQEPIRGMVAIGERIAAESAEEHTRARAGELCDLGNDLLHFVNDISDFSELEAGRLQLTKADYSLRDVISENAELAHYLLGRQQKTFSLDVSESLPNGLRGDAARLKQMIGIIIANAAEANDASIVKLSVFGKAAQGSVHLLVSVRATVQGGGTQAAQQPGSSAPRQHHTSVGMSLVAGLLELMGSQLKTVNSDDDWYENYFEIEQEIVDPTPVGRMEG